MERMGARLIRNRDELEPYEDEWRALAEQRSNAFITPEWFNSWWEFEGGSSSPLVSVVSRPDDSIAGVVPLVLDRSSRPRAVRFAGASLGDCFHPAAAVADEAEVAEATMTALEAVGLDRNMILLEHTAADRAWWLRMKRDSPIKHAIVEQQKSNAPYIDLNGLDWDGYLASRSAKFRKNMRRSERGLREAHDMTIRASTASTVEDDLDELFRLHDLRRAGRGDSSLGPIARRSLRSFAHRALERDWLRLTLMEVHGQAISGFLGWRVGSVFASYQGGFDPAWSKQSVGFAHEGITVRSAIEEGATEYDFLLGTEEWKGRFSDLTRPVQTTVLLRARRPVRLLVVAEAQARRAGSGLGRWDGTRAVVRSMHGLIPTARRS